MEDTGGWVTESNLSPKPGSDVIPWTAGGERDWFRGSANFSTLGLALAQSIRRSPFR
jgi:hypothetical protein